MSIRIYNTAPGGGGGGGGAGTLQATLNAGNLATNAAGGKNNFTLEDSVSQETMYITDNEWLITGHDGSFFQAAYVPGANAYFVFSLSSPNYTKLTFASPTTGQIQTFKNQTGSIALDPTVNAQTGTTYTFQLSDNNNYVTGSNAATQTFTVPPNATVAFPVGTTIQIIQLGAGKITMAPGAGVTINSQGGNLSIAAQYVGASLVKIGTDTWVLMGNLIA